MDKKKSYKVVFDTKKVVIAVFVVLIAAFSLLYFGSKPTNEVPKSDSQKTPEESKTAMENDLIIEDLVEGDGEMAVSGKSAIVHYVGTLENGKEFDSSYDRGAPLRFDIGSGEVIPGWEQGVVGMKVGGKRKLTIPSDLGYGESGSVDGSIPPGATITFEIELLGIEEPSSEK